MDINALPKACGVYLLDNRVTGRYYVGSGLSVRGRVLGHMRLLRSGKHYNWKLRLDVARFGLESFECHVIETCEPQLRFTREQVWIDVLRTVDFGYNIERAARLISDDVRVKTGFTRKGRKLSEEHKRRVSEALKGVKKTREHSQRAADARRGWRQTDEAKAKITAASLGRKHSQESKRKISESKKRYLDEA